MGQKKSGAGAKANFNRAIQSGHSSVNGGGNKAQGQSQSSGLKFGPAGNGTGVQSNSNTGGLLGSAANSAASLNTSNGYYSNTSQGQSQLSSIIKQITSLISQLLKALGKQGNGQGNGGHKFGGGTGGDNSGHATKGTPPKSTSPKKTAPKGCPPKGCPPKGCPPKGCPPKGCPPKGCPPKGCPPKGCPPKGCPPKGCPPKGCPPKGCPPKGCPPKGCPPKGCPPKADRPNNDRPNFDRPLLGGGLGLTGEGGLVHKLTGIPLSPVALDLNGDGKIGVTGATSSKEKDPNAEIGKTVKFDLNADGVKEDTEWFDGSGDGILVDTAKIGANGDLDGSALFGDEGGKYQNGYDKLAGRDSNNDGKISGAELEGLGLWKDDGDAVLEAGELVSASEAGIESISSDMQIKLGADGKNLMQSTATTTDGKQILSEDVWFAQK